jgi:outer membrane protein OmpA-like peptidoglycan-associated protein
MAGANPAFRMAAVAIQGQRVRICDGSKVADQTPMSTHAMTKLCVVASLVAATALAHTHLIAQTPANPSQQFSVPDQQGQTPIFRVTVVGHVTPAINYRPRKGDTEIDFRGTTLMPFALGKAKVQGKKGYIDIEAEFDKLGAPTQFGPEYLTYVLWAITPEGRATNLGEVQVVNNDEARIHVTTELQAFGMIVTAEPYFAVTQPSDVVVVENSVREGTKGSIDVIQAKYELLKRGTYLMNQDTRGLKLKPLEAGAPLDLAEARNAVMLARIAGADRHANDTYLKATRLLTEAESMQARKRGSDAVMMPARQAVQTAEDARLIALQKQEEAFQEEQRARAKERETAALDKARAEEATRRLAELERLQAEAARVAAERDRALADAARSQAEAQAQQAKALAAQAERDKAAAEAARASAEAARLAAESQAQQAQAAAAQADREKAALRDQLRQQLNQILDTRETARGLIVNLSDVLFDTGSATLKPGAREKLARVAGLLLSHPDLKLQVEGHTDSVGDAAYNQRLSENRADSVRTYLVGQGLASNAIGMAGFGENQPVASNDTPNGRQQNRRVELVVAGDAIGTTSPTARGTK